MVFPHAPVVLGLDAELVRPEAHDRAHELLHFPLTPGGEHIHAIPFVGDVLVQARIVEVESAQ